MKRCLKLTAIIITLVLFLSACMKGESDYTPEDFTGTVSFSAENCLYKGDFVFKKEGKSELTITEPQEIKGCVIKEENGGTVLDYDGISADVFSDSSVALLFSALHDFSQKIHKIPQDGIKNIKGTVDSGEYIIEFNCEERKIQNVKIGEMEYIFT